MRRGVDGSLSPRPSDSRQSEREGGTSLANQSAEKRGCGLSSLARSAQLPELLSGEAARAEATEEAGRRQWLKGR